MEVFKHMIEVIESIAIHPTAKDSGYLRKKIHKKREKRGFIFYVPLSFYGYVVSFAGKNDASVSSS